MKAGIECFSQEVATAAMTVTIKDMQKRLQELVALVSKRNTIIIEKDKKPLVQKKKVNKGF